MTRGVSRIEYSAFPGIDPLGAVGQQEVRSVLETGTALQDGSHHLFGRAGVGRGFEDHQDPGMEMVGNLARGRLDEGEIGSPIVQRSWHTDEDQFGLVDQFSRRGKRQVPALERRAEQRRVDACDGKFATCERVHARRVDVDAGCAEPGLGGCGCERKTYVTLADYRDRSTTLDDPGGKDI